MVLGGDFNCIDSVVDRLNIKLDFSADKRVLSALKANFCLVYIWRKRNPSVISYTWVNSDFSQASRLDQFFISRSLLSLVRYNKRFTCTLSDHNYVDLFLSLYNGNPSGSSVWKFNSTFWLIVILLLKCKILFSHHSLIPSFSPLGAWWDDLKVSIRSACVDYSVQKCKRLNWDRDLLTKQLIRAKQLIFSGDSRYVDTVNDLRGLKYDLVLGG